MNAKKIIGFLVMRPAFTQRNMTSIMLVAIFFGVYVMMGGKITTQLPKLNEEGSFGSAKSGNTLPMPGQFNKQSEKDTAQAVQDSEDAAPQRTVKKRKSSLQLLGLEPTNERKARRRALLGKTLFDQEEREELEDQPIDKDGLVEGVVEENIHLERRLQRVEQRRKSDPLSDIEERLKSRGR